MLSALITKRLINLNKNTSAVVSCTHPDTTSMTFSPSTASPSVPISFSTGTFVVTFCGGGGKTMKMRRRRRRRRRENDKIVEKEGIQE